MLPMQGNVHWKLESSNSKTPSLRKKTSLDLVFVGFVLICKYVELLLNMIPRRSFN